MEFMERTLPSCGVEMCFISVKLKKQPRIIAWSNAGKLILSACSKSQLGNLWFSNCRWGKPVPSMA